jgi:nucleoside-diphosphate-sugar epimerase
MIIGNGLLARAFSTSFTNDAKVTVFASGVANSSETRTEQFERERLLLRQTMREEGLLIYFGTCSMHDPELAKTPYLRHKAEMENLVREGARQWAIMRLPQLVGHCSNPNTLANFLYRHIAAGLRFQLWTKASRNIIDVADVATIITHLVTNGSIEGMTANIACPFSQSMPELVKIFERVLGRQANYESVAAGGKYPIDTHLTTTTASHVGIVFDNQYTENCIRKYYG